MNEQAQLMSLLLAAMAANGGKLVVHADDLIRHYERLETGEVQGIVGDKDEDNVWTFTASTEPSPMQMAVRAIARMLGMLPENMPNLTADERRAAGADADEEILRSLRIKP